MIKILLIPLSLQTTLCLSFPNAVANMSTTVLGRIEAKFDPKETMIKPSPPGLSTNSSRSGGSGLPSLTLSGPTIIFPFQNNTNRDETFTNAFYLPTETEEVEIF